MSNEVRIMKGATFNYEYKPAEIDITNYEGLVERAEMVADHYDSLVFKNAELSDITLAHQELNSFVKGLEDSRKKVKQEYQKPLKEFEKKIKNVTEKLNKPLYKIKEARDEILTAQEETRREALIDFIERKLKDTNVKIEDLEFDDRWTNKGNWTEKLNPRKPLKEEIEAQINQVQEDNKKMIAERKVLETFLEERDMEPEGWISQLENREALDIISDISAAEKKRKEAAKRKAEEEQRKAENIVHEEVSHAEQINTPEEVEKSATVEKPVAEFKIEEEPKEEVHSEIIEIITTPEKMMLLDQFMTENKITYRPYEPVYMEDDLPF